MLSLLMESPAEWGHFEAEFVGTKYEGLFVEMYFEARM